MIFHSFVLDMLFFFFELHVVISCLAPPTTTTTANPPQQETSCRTTALLSSPPSRQITKVPRVKPFPHRRNRQRSSSTHQVRPSTLQTHLSKIQKHGLHPTHRPGTPPSAFAALTSVPADACGRRSSSLIEGCNDDGVSLTMEQRLRLT